MTTNIPCLAMVFIFEKLKKFQPILIVFIVIKLEKIKINE